MVYARHPLRGCQYGIYRLCKVAGGSRSTDLIGHYPQLRPFFAETAHSLYKIVTIGRVEPSRAHYHAFGKQSQQCSLPLTLRHTIVAYRMYSIRFFVGSVASPVKHIVCRDMHHLCPLLVGRIGDIFTASTLIREQRPWSDSALSTAV